MKVNNISSDDFLKLIQKGQREELNHYSDLFIYRLSLYLRQVFKADESVIEDISQSVYADIFEKVKSGRVRGVNSLMAYMITSARHRFLAWQKKKFEEVPLRYSNFNDPDFIHDDSEAAEKQEREELLEKCLEKMAADKTDFFSEVMKHINKKDKDTAKLLGISHQNFRTKKSRIVEMLRLCVESEKRRREN
ncbi:MAG: sigma-70 family RNA polymerase sigma factor [Balneolaceae bacterium]|nr:MAG: sigma-70 family RNA polymerase sigma factor [Balneolaceae bacterium]